MRSACCRVATRSGGDRAGHADGEAGAGEGVAADEGLGQAQLAAELAHLVLEQLAQGLDQGQVHALGQAADIVVRLDGDAGALEGDALDHVGVEGALGEEADVGELARPRRRRRR